MKARSYIEESFIPWILFLDPEDTIKHFKEKKEEYLCETYNHISKEFKSIDHYEMYMFRVNMMKMVTLRGHYNLIIAKLPDIKNAYESSLMVIAIGGEELIYYYLNYSFSNQFDLLKRTKKEKTKLASFANPQMDDIMKSIKADLM